MSANVSTRRSTRKDLTGKQFGKWTVLSYSHTIANQAYWLCRCTCGREMPVRGKNLRSNNSGGCLSCHLARISPAGTVASAQKVTTHGHCRGPSRHNQQTPTYRSWVAMLTRCRNPKCKDWPHYGGRGITICDRWLGFENFLADMGERPPGMTLDRYPDPDGNYERDNCRWATASQQQTNKRRR
jgi:hypothetical protein